MNIGKPRNSLMAPPISLVKGWQSMLVIVVSYRPKWMIFKAEPSLRSPKELDDITEKREGTFFTLKICVVIFAATI